MKISHQQLSAPLLPQVAALSGEDPVQIQLRGAVDIDALTTLILACLLSRKTAPILIDIAGNALTSSAQESLHRSLFIPLLLPKGLSKGKYEIDPAEVAVRENFIVPKVLLLPAEALVCNNSREFQRLIAQAFRRAEIVVPTELLILLSSIGFEATLNAEEHGSVRLGGGESNEGIRGFAAMVHADGTTLDSRAREYVSQYVAQFRRPEGGWLEIIVIDNGMGLAYPNFYLSALERGLDNPHLYTTNPAIERARLEEALKDGFTTKGRWGKLVSTQTRPGAGTEVIRKRLGSVRGYSALRTGRSAATWSYLRPRVAYVRNTLRGDHPDNIQPFIIQTVQPEFVFEGTAWQFVIPLTAQAELPL